MNYKKAFYRAQRTFFQSLSGSFGGLTIGGEIDADLNTSLVTRLVASLLTAALAGAGAFVMNLSGDAEVEVEYDDEDPIEDL